MPYAPAIKINSGKLLWLSGNTALPVYHDHPHRREDILKYMPNDLAAQTRAAMEGISRRWRRPAQTSATLFTCSRSARDRGWKTSASPMRSSTGTFRPYNHKPTSTSVSVLELGEPEQLVEIQMVAVVN